MNLRGFFRRPASHAPSPDELPQLHAFLDVFVGGRPPQHVIVEAVDERGILLAGVLGVAGEAATLVYTTPAGKFRAETRVVSVGENMLLEGIRSPENVGAGGGQKRRDVRLDALVQGAWRFAPGGKGIGDFGKCSIGDISRGGCSVIVDRELRAGTQIEVRLYLKAAETLELLAEVMRHHTIAQSGKHSHGVRFVGLRPAEDREIADFINRRQSDLRNRGLA